MVVVVVREEERGDGWDDGAKVVQECEGKKC